MVEDLGSPIPRICLSFLVSSMLLDGGDSEVCVMSILTRGRASGDGELLRNLDPAYFGFGVDG